MNEKKLEQIKEKIRTINPEITDELLDLLYEYIFSKYYNNITKEINQISKEDLSILFTFFLLNHLQCFCYHF